MFAWLAEKRAQARNRREEKKFLAAVAFLQTKRPDLFQQFIAERATDLAFTILMQELDREGIRHCALCPSRQQLHSHNGKHLCGEHYAAQLKAAPAPAEAKKS